MRRPRWVCVLGLTLLLCVTGVARGQTVPTGVPSSEVRARVKGEQFGLVSSVRGLPLGVRDALEGLFGNRSLDIAEPGADFQAAGKPATNRLPLRRLVAAGCSVNYCLVYYERGGEARPSWRLMLFHWMPDTTTLQWGATAPGGLTSLEDVRKAVLSGTGLGETKVW